VTGLGKKGDAAEHQKAFDRVRLAVKGGVRGKARMHLGERGDGPGAERPAARGLRQGEEGAYRNTGKE
jgi:hypothetical protein